MKFMKKTDKDSKMVTGAIVGGIIGICTLAIILSLRSHKESNLSHLSELFEKHNIEEPKVMKQLGNQLKVHESTLLEVADWLLRGMSLWKKFQG